MNIYLSQLLVVAGIHLLAVMSPGPDFLMVSKYSMTKSRKAGVFAAIGVALGIGVHVLYAVLGVSALIASSVWLFKIIKIAGAMYLIYIGVSSFRSSGEMGDSETVGVGQKGNASGRADSRAEAKPETVAEKPTQIIRAGFLTNVLNPKATLFFLAVFTQVVTPETPIWVKSIYGAEMILATGIWFSIVALGLSTTYMARKIQSYKRTLDRVTGVFLAGLGFKILLE
jgi:RhtB (resistance to homoserine/threonine) family protein